MGELLGWEDGGEDGGLNELLESMDRGGGRFFLLPTYEDGCKQPFFLLYGEEIGRVEEWVGGWEGGRASSYL